jgi:hypothetical protein
MASAPPLGGMCFNLPFAQSPPAILQIDIENFVEPQG